MATGETNMDGMARRLIVRASMPAVTKTIIGLVMAPHLHRLLLPDVGYRQRATATVATIM